jgi:peptidyl-prolyl cis-trans isomerase C
MKRYPMISVWLIILIVVSGLGCRKKPSSETQPEPNAPARIDMKIAEPKQVVKAAADAVAVTVNGRVINENEVEAEINQIVPLIPPGELEKNKERLRQNILERMITKHLLDERIKAVNIVVTEEEVLGHIREMASRQGLSLDDFKKLLQTRGMNFDEWRKQMQFERIIQLQKLFDAEMADRLNITEDDAKSYYSANTKQFDVPEQVRASHILIKPDTADPNADPNEAKAKALARAQDLLKQIKEGADFAELAKAAGGDASATKGGDLGFFKRGFMVPPFEEAAFALKVDEVSDVVQTRFGYHIIKVTDRKEAGVRTFEQAKDDIINMLRQQKQGELVAEYIESLKAEAEIVYPPGKEPSPLTPNP